MTNIAAFSLPLHGLQVLQTGLYFLAGLVLAAGLAAGISLVTSADYLAANPLLSLQLVGNAALSNLIGPILSGFFINAGLATFSLPLVMSALLYPAGRLTRRII